MSEPWSDEETDNPLRADDRNFYKVEKRTRDGAKVERAGNNLDRVVRAHWRSSISWSIVRAWKQWCDGDDRASWCPWRYRSTPSFFLSA